MVFEEFWRLTPYETRLFIESFVRRQKGKYQYGVWIAWHAAAMGRMRRMPSLGKVLRSILTGDQKQSVEEALEVARSINSLVGGKDKI